MKNLDIPVLLYDDERKNIKNGDVLLYKGTSVFSKLIQRVTGSSYSHAGLAVWWNKRLMVMEAVGKGVVVTPLSINVGHYHGGVEWFQHVEEIEGKDRQELVSFAQLQLGKEYGTLGVIYLGLYRIFQWDVDKRDKLRRSKRLFCSQYVSQAYNAIGRDLRMNAGDRFMSPKDLLDSPYLKQVAILKKPN